MLDYASILDTAQEVFPAAFSYLGLPPDSRSLADLDTAAVLLQRIQPDVRKFHSSQYINDLATGDLCVALGYSGDVIQARDPGAQERVERFAAAGFLERAQEEVALLVGNLRVDLVGIDAAQVDSQ